MENFEFKSQICTSVEQSKRLLELGIKKETADMHISNISSKGINYTDDWQIGSTPYCNIISFWNSNGFPLEKTAWSIFPAWSLGRLIKDLMPQGIGRFKLAVGSDYAGYYEDIYYSDIGVHWEYVEETPDMFDNIISTIEWLIKEGFFNKNYLEERK